MQFSSVERRSGFSLVELSIVLVILGLLVGGVLSGRALIRAAELRNITVEYQQYQTAINTFRDKYRALPGDFNKATDFWTVAAGCGSLHATNAVGTGRATCNGNGNGTVNSPSPGTASSSPTAPVIAREDLLFWQHLSNAGLIEGSYDVSTTIVRGKNVPASKASAQWSVINYPTGDATMFSGARTINLFRFSGNDGVAGALSPEEAWGIDTKLDDGNPTTGVVFSYPVANCTVAADGSTTPPGNVALTTSRYMLSGSGNTCPLFLVM